MRQPKFSEPESFGVAVVNLIYTTTDICKNSTQWLPSGLSSFAPTAEIFFRPVKAQKRIH
ncbi:hypothetical protein VFPPC_15908 [Pochonia chlamydosporia 170]|uniref:Uncharacterized protein n=1 Tax=Pochonia chlamydosporia 170 TaxID=1380566 RepID=A0A179FVA2_METCM|nr:hypothetical protein VFPPC_15908 [Pochonia chlamydosporia 170]OAQ69003.1 hypothetical protein VFPPC_15908 [Pochonia chlamydosporia 170]